MGPTSGYLAVLVFSLYINSETVRTLYPSAFILWMICPLLLYWISRIWFLAKRQQVPHDPVEFALTDPNSWVVILGIAICMLFARFI
jgi:hypothetical protein